MRRSALALGASVIALALTAGPAAADPAPGQTVTDTAGAVQVGAVGVNAPVRVASDGESSATGVTAGGPQATGDSTGAAQVTSVHAGAPVRVLSDGDDADSGASGGGPQATDDSTAAGQVGPADVNAPVRMLSDGDNTGQSGAPAGSQQTTDSAGSAQVGSPSIGAPVRVLSDGDTSTAGGPGTGPQEVRDSTGTAQVGSPALFVPVRVISAAEGPGSGGDDIQASPSAVAPIAGDGGGSPSPEELRRLMDGADPDPAVVLGSGDTAAGGDAGQFATLGVAASSLPLTGSRPFDVLAFGMWLLMASVLAMRIVPGGRRG
jgi:hypothetical protein